MSIFKKIGKALGKVASIGSKVAGFIPGVGPVASGVLGGVGAGLEGKNILKGAASGALSGIGGGLLSKIGGPAVDAAAEGALRGKGGVVGGLFGRITDAIAKDPMKAAQYGLAGLNMIQGAQAQGKANKVNEDLMRQVMADQAQRQQLQQIVMQRLQQQGGGANPFGQVM